MVAEIGAAFEALKIASDTAKSLIQLRDIALVRGKAVELQGQILAAQQIALDTRAREESLISQISELKEQVTQLERWSADKEAYALNEVGTGAFAYVRKPNAEPAEPPHWLCTNCFNNHRKSILQYAGRTGSNRESLYTCPMCENRILVPWSQNPKKSAESLQKPKQHLTPIPCPYCGEGTELLDESRHPDFPEMLKQHTLRCVGCNKEFTRDFESGKGYI